MNNLRNLERPPFTRLQIEQMERIEARQSHLLECERLVEEARDILEWVWCDGNGREVFPNNLDGSPSEDFERIQQFLADTKTAE